MPLTDKGCEVQSAKLETVDRATSMTWTGTVGAARRLHAEAKRAEREREAAASRAATDEGEA